MSWPSLPARATLGLSPTKTFVSSALPTSGRGVLVDTSVAVPLLVENHDAHERVLSELEPVGRGLAGHAWFETFSVLTRLPGAARRPPMEVALALRATFPVSRFLDAEGHERTARRLVELGIAGGAVYDALVGATAEAYGMPLVTRDRRALEIYRRLGVDVELLD